MKDKNKIKAEKYDKVIKFVKKEIKTFNRYVIMNPDASYEDKMSARCIVGGFLKLGQEVGEDVSKWIR